jgi:hypothetical protein
MSESTPNAVQFSVFAFSTILPIRLYQFDNRIATTKRVWDLQVVYNRIAPKRELWREGPERFKRSLSLASNELVTELFASAQIRLISSVNLQVHMCSYAISDLYMHVLCMYIQAQYRHICICSKMHILFICLYVYAWFRYVCIHQYTSVCAYVTPICIYVYICTYVYVYSCIVCIRIYLCLILYAPVYVCICLYMFVFVYISMYMYISLQYMHIHAHKSAYIHISLDEFYSMWRAGYVCVCICMYMHV